MRDGGEGRICTQLLVVVFEQGEGRKEGCSTGYL